MRLLLGQEIKREKRLPEYRNRTQEENNQQPITQRQADRQRPVEPMKKSSLMHQCVCFEVLQLLAHQKNAAENHSYYSDALPTLYHRVIVHIIG